MISDKQPYTQGKNAENITVESTDNSNRKIAAIDLENSHQLWPFMIQSISIAAMVCAFILLSRLPAANFAELSPFWPVTGMAIPILQYNRWHVLSLMFGVVLWAIVSDASLTIALLLPLTLLGPLIYALLRAHINHPSLGQKKPFFFIVDYVAIGFIAILPSSVIGSLLYFNQSVDYALVDTFFVYVLSDLLGVLIFLPLTEVIINQKNKAFELFCNISKPLLFTIALAALPMIFNMSGYSAYATAAEILLFPLFAVMISRYSRECLAICSLVLCIIIAMSAGYGAEQLNTERQIESFLFVTFWLIAILLATQILQHSAAKQRYLIHKNQFLASHNPQSKAPNQVKMEHDFTNSGAKYLTLIQVKDRDSLSQTLDTANIANLEQQLYLYLQEALANRGIYHLAEMRFAVLTQQSLHDQALEAQQFKVELGSSSNIINLAWGIIRCQADSFDSNLSIASAALNIALKQPNLRVFGPRYTYEIDEQLAQLDDYQRYMQALESDKLKLYYQPILNLEEGKITAAELLSRLVVDNNIISPDRFTEVFKKFDGLARFDRCVIKQAAKQLSSRELNRLKKININLTGASLSDESFIPWLDKTLKASDYPQQNICFEITESDHIRNWPQAINNANKLIHKGFQLAIDDFGTGLASFEYLEKFSMAKLLKIDGAFIKDLDNDHTQKAFVQASMLIAEAKQLDVCAEYVDNDATLNYLKKQGVKYAQGYFISKPLELPKQ